MNKSEKQLFEFLKFKAQHDKKIILMLSPQGDNTIIERESVNLCSVHLKNNIYRFGGISEKVYNKMVKKYHKKIIYEK